MKVVFVDLDYTVLVNPFWPGVFPTFAKHVATHSPLRPTEHEVIDDLMARSRALSLKRDVAANDWDTLTGKSATAFQVIWTEPIAQLVERFADLAGAVPGAREMLAALRAAGWTCVAASAGFRRFQLPTLRRLGLLDCFDQLIFADDNAAPKRHRAFYGPIHHATTHVACIGDSYVDDCLYPAHFGFNAIWFTGARPTTRVPCGRRPTAHVAHLDDIADALASLTASAHNRYHPQRGPACPTCGARGAPTEPCTLCRCIDRHDHWDGTAAPERQPNS